MALSNKIILEQIKAGDIYISPFESENLSTSSYDVRLGQWFCREERVPRPGRQDNVRLALNFYNPYNKKDVEHVWGKPIYAQTLREEFERFNFAFTKDENFWKELEENISLDDLVILIEPGETILAHTEEFIGGINHITTSMQARSSHGRNFLEVCKCAGWGDVGYINRWTMEITNISRYHALPLVVGRRYAQIVFDETGPILDEDYSKKGKYQQGSNPFDIEKNWKPHMMIPKLYLDRDIKKKS